jgi:large subunit ribosomal protein L16
MQTQPQNVKYKKYHKKRFFKGIEYRSNNLQFGYYGLKSLNSGIMNYKHIESGRKAINQILKRSGKIWIRIFPRLSLTKKPIEVRMGKGKGNVNVWVCYIKPGTIIYEINSTNKVKSIEALKNASIKLPLQTKIVYKNY